MENRKKSIILRSTIQTLYIIFCVDNLIMNLSIAVEILRLGLLLSKIFPCSRVNFRLTCDV